MQHGTPCTRYLCGARGPRGRVAPVSLCRLLLPPHPALQHRPPTGAHGRRVEGEQEVPPLRRGECEEGRGGAGSGRVGRGEGRGGRGRHGGDAVRADGVGRGQVLAAAVRHGGQRRQGRGGGGGGAPPPHGQGDPLGGDGVDLGGHGAAGGAGEGQRGGGQTVTIQLLKSNGKRWGDERRKRKRRGKMRQIKKAGVKLNVEERLLAARRLTWGEALVLR